MNPARLAESHASAAAASRKNTPFAPPRDHTPYATPPMHPVHPANHSRPAGSHARLQRHVTIWPVNPVNQVRSESCESLPSRRLAQAREGRCCLRQRRSHTFALRALLARLALVLALALPRTPRDTSVGRSRVGARPVAASARLAALLQGFGGGGVPTRDIRVAPRARGGRGGAGAVFGAGPRPDAVYKVVYPHSVAE